MVIDSSWASLLGLLLLSGYLAIYPALFLAFTGTILRSPREKIALGPPLASGKEAWWIAPFLNLKRATLAGFCWCSLELIRDHLFTGFSWNGYYSALIEQPVLAQAAEFSGALSLSFLPVFSAALLWGIAERIHLRFQRRLSPRPQLDLLFLTLGFGLLLIHAIPHLRIIPAPKDLQLKALALQPLLSQEEKWNEDFFTEDQRQQLYLNLQQQGIQAAKQLEAEELTERFFLQQQSNNQAIVSTDPGRIDLLLLPESAYSDYLTRFQNEIPESYGIIPQGSSKQVEVKQAILSQLKQLQTGNYSVISGVNSASYPSSLEQGDKAQQQEETLYYNSLIQLTPQKTYLHYDKQHLVPFGEYLPLPQIFPFLKEFIPGDFNAGSTNQPELSLTLNNNQNKPQQIPLTSLICFEDTIARIARQSTLQNPQRVLLINSTNDGYFSEMAAAQHLAHARFRSIELRRPMLRSGNSGGTAAIQANGLLLDPWSLSPRRQILETPSGSLEQQGALFARLLLPSPTSPPTTLYLRWGNWFGALSLLAVVVTLLLRIYHHTNLRRKNEKG